MHNLIMGSLDGKSESIAVGVGLLERVIARENIHVVSLAEDSGVLIEVDGRRYPVDNPVNGDGYRPYFFLLKNGSALNVHDYRLLFDAKKLPDSLIQGVDASGKTHHCRLWDGGGKGVGDSTSPKDLDDKLGMVHETLEELKDLKEMIQKLRDGEFFESLALELTGKIREAAEELVEFRNDFGKKIQPDIVKIADEDIPEASNQLEGINETLEESTMKIMDINEEQMAIAGQHLGKMTALLESGIRGAMSAEGIAVLEEVVGSLKKMNDLSLKMMEPLSFQDLVGQRIQRIIKLVKSMETRIRDMIISLGLKIRIHKENPEKTFDDLREEVEKYKSDLKGPQRQGEGMDQSDIDDLLATL
jgi:chemotaxis protein CheZ